MNILHEDPEFVVIEKPGGLLSVPGRGPEKQDCVVRRLQRLFPAMITQPAVHRLDMYTSGLMTVAITDRAHRRLSRQFAQRRVTKGYIALLEGKIENSSGEIHLPFRLDPDNRPYQVHDPVHGKMGSTLWQLLAHEPAEASPTSRPQPKSADWNFCAATSRRYGLIAADCCSRVRFTPLTGRTHQLRVHAAHPLGLGHPIVGDSLYGNGSDGDPMLLHAERLAFFHPVSGERLVFTSPPPF